MSKREFPKYWSYTGSRLRGDVKDSGLKPGHHLGAPSTIRSVPRPPTNCPEKKFANTIDKQVFLVYLHNRKQDAGNNQQRENAHEVDAVDPTAQRGAVSTIHCNMLMAPSPYRMVRPAMKTVTAIVLVLLCSACQSTSSTPILINGYDPTLTSHQEALGWRKKRHAAQSD